MTLLIRDQENIEKGQISAELKKTIYSENSLKVLKRWLKTAIKSNNIEEYVQSMNHLK